MPLASRWAWIMSADARLSSRCFPFSFRLSLTRCSCGGGGGPGAREWAAALTVEGPAPGLSLARDCPLVPVVAVRLE